MLGRGGEVMCGEGWHVWGGPMCGCGCMCFLVDVVKVVTTH